MTAKASKITGDGRYYFSTELAGVEQEADTIERGFWAGGAAEALLLKDSLVAEKAFLNLFAGRSPDGRTKLVRNADSRGRQSAHEVLLSPDKSIGTVWAAADGLTQAKIIDSFFAAARAVLAELEKTCGFARMGAGGKEVVKAEQIFAVFLHLTSRAQDPQPHFHIVRPNLGRCPDGQYRALVSHDVYSAQRRLNALFNFTLANELEQRVGLKVVLSGQACAIEGVPKTLLTEFSTRRQQILAHTEALGFDSPQSNQIAAYATRPEKVEFPLDALHKMWRETAGRHRFDVEKLPRLSAAAQAARALVPEPLRLMAVMQEAGKILTRASAAFGEQAFLSAAYLAGIGKGVTPEQVRSAVTAVFERPRAHGLVPAGTSGDQPLFHTKAQVGHEARLDRLTRRWPNTRFTLDHDQALRAIMTLQQVGLPPEELASAARLTLRPQGLVLLTGQDPAAHDRVLRAVRAVYARQDLRVVCVSSSQEAGQKAFGDTVPAIGARSFLQTLAGQPWLRAHLEALRVAARDLSRHASLVEALKHAENAYRDSRRGRPLDDRTVLLVHDTGRIPAADLAALLARARSGGSKVVLADGPALLEPTLSADLFRRLSGRYPAEIVGQGPAPVERPSNTPPPARSKVQKPELGLEQ